MGLNSRPAIPSRCALWNSAWGLRNGHAFFLEQPILFVPPFLSSIREFRMTHLPPYHPKFVCMAWFSALALVFGISNGGAAVVWNSVQWFSWTPALNPAASTGAVSGQQIAVTVTGTNAANAGSGTSNFDVQQNGTYSMPTPTLGLGAPKGGSTVTYTIDLSALTMPSSGLVIGINNLDAFEARGSITVSAVTDANQSSDVNSWATEAQFKQQAGTPSAQSLVTRSNLGNSMLLGTAQGVDNTSWGDSRGIFFTGLAADLKTITLSHYYSHSNPTVSDNIALYVGIVPEPSSALLGLLGASVLTTRRRRRAGVRNEG